MSDLGPATVLFAPGLSICQHSDRIVQISSRGREFNTLQVIKNLAYYVLRICLISSAPGKYLLRVSPGIFHCCRSNIPSLESRYLMKQKIDRLQGSAQSFRKNGHRY